MSDSRDVEREPEAAWKACVRPRSPAQNLSSAWPPQDPDHDDDRPEVELCIAAARIGTFEWDLASGRLTGDELLSELFDFDADTFGSTIEALNSRGHPQDRTRVAGVLGTAINECGDYMVEYRITLPSTGDRWVGSHLGGMCDQLVARMLPPHPDDDVALVAVRLHRQAR